MFRRVLTGAVAVAGMGAIVFGNALEAQSFVLTEDFRYELQTGGGLTNSFLNRGWVIGNASYPNFPTKPPQAPDPSDPDFENKQAIYNQEQQIYDLYQSFGLQFGWQQDTGESSENNPFINSSFLAGAFFEPDVTISTWALSPVIPLENGAQLSFDTRQIPYRFSDLPDENYPNRLEVRYSITDSCRAIDTAPTSCEPRVSDGSLTLAETLTVGDFTYQFLNDEGLPLVINPNLETNGYPNVWTRVTGRISGLTQPTFGRIGFRYFVPQAALSQSNASYIGIDNFNYSTPIPTPAMLPGLIGMGIGAIRKRRQQQTQSNSQAKA